MTVIILENVSPSLRGEISKWLIEIKAGVFIGKINALIRDYMWDKCTASAQNGSVLMVWNKNNEQGFDLRQWNTKNYLPEEFEGIWLVKRPMT